MANHTSEGQGEKGIEYTKLLHVLCHQVPCPFSRDAHVFHSLLFAADVLVGVFLFDLHTCHQVQLQVSYGFSNLMPVHLDTLFLPANLSLLLPLACFLFISEFYQELLPGLLPHLMDFLLIGMGWTIKALKKMILWKGGVKGMGQEWEGGAGGNKKKTPPKQPSLTHFHPRAVHHRVLPSQP